MPAISHFQLLLIAGEAGLVPGGYGWALFKVLFALGLICLVAFLLVRLLRGRLGSGLVPGRGHLRVLDRYPLSPRQTLWLVEVGGRIFMLGAGEGGISRLAELEPEELESPAPGLDEHSGVSFGRLLQRLRTGGDKDQR